MVLLSSLYFHNEGASLGASELSVRDYDPKF